MVSSTPNRCNKVKKPHCCKQPTLLYGDLTQLKQGGLIAKQYSSNYRVKEESQQGPEI
jgi:hypothetical protein